MRRPAGTLALLALIVGACGGATVSPTPGSSSPWEAPARGSTGPTTGPSGAATAPSIKLEPIVDGLDRPVDVAWRPNDAGSLFVVEQTGRIRIVRDGKLLERPFLDITDLVKAGGEQGLLGLAFPPTAVGGRFFVYYTALDGQQTVASYDTSGDDADRADRATARIWLTMPDQFANHNGGSLVFGPDGFLYVGTGDGGGGGDPLDSGRHLDTLLAKVLRVDVSGEPAGSGIAYRIPPDNPFVGTSGARPEIWLTGLRNPWRIHFDRANGDLWIADVGQGSWEEIDVVRAGQKGLDYGWNTMEGAHCFGDATECDRSGLTLPVAEYDHDFGCAVSGGAVYRGSAFPALAGWYFLSDYCSGTFWAVNAETASSDDTITPAQAATSDYSISAIAGDASGELFATDLSKGTLLRIGLAGS
jgi:glucose/arabinose dehydrogenase